MAQGLFIKKVEMTVPVQNGLASVGDRASSSVDEPLCVIHFLKFLRLFIKVVLIVLFLRWYHCGAGWHQTW